MLASLASDSEISTQTDVGSGIDVSEFDMDRYVRSTTPLSDDLKHRLLTNQHRRKLVTVSARTA